MERVLSIIGKRGLSIVGIRGLSSAVKGDKIVYSLEYYSDRAMMSQVSTSFILSPVYFLNE